MKTIWIMNHYATNQYIEHGGRHYNFAKYLIRAGYDVKIFCASTIHNTDKNLITDKRKYYTDECDGIPFVIVKCRNYTGNGKSRILNILDFYRGILKTSSDFVAPDVVIGSSVHPLTCVAAIKLGKRYKCKVISEIRDLWPESIVAYGVKSPNNPVIKIMYCLERWIYVKADAIIFTMEGGKDYIIEKGWDIAHGGPVELSKIYHINNGVDLELFEYEKEYFTVDDKDLDDPETYKVVYTGSVRHVNDVGQLLDVVRILKGNGNDKIKILIYGDGDERETLEKNAKEFELNNIIFKGRVEKKYIPYILSKCDLCLLHWHTTPIVKYGMSMNKLFEYFAAGIPVISNAKPGYDAIEILECGVSENIISSEEYAEEITRITDMQEEKYRMFCENAKNAAKEYDFAELTRKLMNVIDIVK